MLYTKYQDFGRSTCKETSTLLLQVREFYINGGHFEIQDSRNMLFIKKFM